MGGGVAARREVRGEDKRGGKKRSRKISVMSNSRSGNLRCREIVMGCHRGGYERKACPPGGGLMLRRAPRSRARRTSNKLIYRAINLDPGFCMNQIVSHLSRLKLNAAVTPAQAGVHFLLKAKNIMGPGFRRDDGGEGSRRPKMAQRSSVSSFVVVVRP